MSLQDHLQQIRYNTITTLNLRGNKMGADGSQHLVAALATNSTLTSLNLAHRPTNITELLKQNQHNTKQRALTLMEMLI